MLRRVATMREHHMKAPAEQSPGEGTMFDRTVHHLFA